jgi:hypothetical protein
VIFITSSVKIVAKQASFEQLNRARSVQAWRLPDAPPAPSRKKVSSLDVFGAIRPVSVMGGSGPAPAARFHVKHRAEAQGRRNDPAMTRQ